MLSTPTGHGPLSTTAAIRPSSPAITCPAVVGDTAPDRLAEGAATGRPTARINASASACAGTRTANVSNPAPASSATGHVTRRGSTIVNGPGQNASASARAAAPASTCANAAAASG